MRISLKILHINLAKGFRGGERQTELLIRALSIYEELEQYLACRIDSPLRDKLKNIKNITFINANNQVLGHIQCPKVDILHAHDAKAVHWAWLHHKITKIPYILTRRVDHPVKDKWLNKRTYSQSSCNVAISTLIKSLLDKNEWSNNTNLIPSVMADFKLDKNVRDDFRRKYKGKTLIGNAAAIVDKHKGQRLLIETARDLKDSHPDLHFVLFGRGEDEEALKNESKDLSNLTWEGFKEDIGNYISALDIFAFPSRNEGLGSTLLDVMNANIPIIAADTGGIPDIIINNKTGLLFKVNNKNDLKEKLLTLINNDTLIEKLTSNARKHASIYTPENMAHSYVELYKKLT